MYSIFETEITVRPDDIDMNNHVHYSRYLDYLLMARYDQMKKDYKVSMEEFVERGYSWVASDVNIQYKRPILLQDSITVRTQVKNFHGAQVVVSFWIVKGEREKVAAQGEVGYTMVSVRSGRPVRIPDEIIEKYQV
ncbi:MAG: acyl-CoA thioesterase [Proteobacteria bacterium]|nr:acyl-CoA thioesterase [Pseudomonadota bacterium]MBU1416913.1 acyl-CoA thioesterase [Pseudomonadota bacterium]MBU1454069.1 acyl-CoA thioesterase [Pseudomonadota bacterium]